MRCRWGMKTMLILGLMAAFGMRPAAAQRTAPVIDRIEALVGERLAQWCRAAKMRYPPEAVLFRVFKQEGRFEIWGKQARMHQMRKIRTLRICAVDRHPGPKVARGDGRTPEGVFNAAIAYGSRYDWMWMDLAAGRVDRPGRTGRGDAFKICLDYPRAADRARSAALGASPGGGICLHGNCVSAGCISFRNRDFLAVFAFAVHHRADRFGPLQVHIFPFDFDRVPDLAEAAMTYASANRQVHTQLRAFWRKLQQEYSRFNRQPNPMQRRAPIAKTDTGSVTGTAMD